MFVFESVFVCERERNNLLLCAIFLPLVQIPKSASRKSSFLVSRMTLHTPKVEAEKDPHFDTDNSHLIILPH